MKKILILFLLAACASPQSVYVPLPVLPPLVLVHGAHFDGQSWQLVTVDLEKRGLRVSAPTLPGRPVFQNVTLTQMASAVCAGIQEASVLVGHSQGGAVINQMLGLCPQKILKLIYVSAVVPLPGETAFEKLSKADTKAYGEASEFLSDRLHPKGRKALMRAFDREIEISEFEFAKVYDEPLGPGSEPLKFDLQTFMKVPKVYIHANRDPVISLLSQKKYTQRSQFHGDLVVDAGHLPMLTAPAELSRLIAASL